ncbi:MAG: hypothetical protein P4L79_10140 [Legionella sp.]|uniref:hypothetical protein n=1 Tax=Legionella sp. TaxID=459 RepID=UPI002845C715|nr:hypothetical protein [Legionella sp.]
MSPDLKAELKVIINKIWREDILSEPRDDVIDIINVIVGIGCYYDLSHVLYAHDKIEKRRERGELANR